MHTKGAKAWYDTTYRAIVPYIKERQEARAITIRLLTYYLGYTTTKYILNAPLTATKLVAASLARAIQRLCLQEPLAYILGSTNFYGRLFQTNPTVLIPRSSTEELVDFIIQDYTCAAPTILDLGTGSGCIAITLAKEYKDAMVHGVDVCPKALTVARKNAKVLQAKIHFHLLDMLTDELPSLTWDMIVSNPPYVYNGEKAQLHKCVLAYEPHQALFVPDNDPLVFYKRIALLAPACLSPKGVVYVEINQAFGKEVKALFVAAGFQQVSLHGDMHGSDRWVVAKGLGVKKYTF